MIGVSIVAHVTVIFCQSESGVNAGFTGSWMHNGFLNIDNRKMSKALGNFFTVREISEKYDLQVLRFFMLSAHYRSTVKAGQTTGISATDKEQLGAITIYKEGEVLT